MSWTPVTVHSRAELEKLLQDHPMQLRPTRRSFGPRVGHPEFFGPVDPARIQRYGTVRFDADGAAWVELPEDPPRSAWAQRWSSRGGVR